MPRPFPGRLDELISQSYVTVEPGVGVCMRYPRHSEVMEHADSLVASVDSSDHFLLRKFDLVYRDLLRRPPSEWSDPGETSREIANAK